MVFAPRGRGSCNNGSIHRPGQNQIGQFVNGGIKVGCVSEKLSASRRMNWSRFRTIKRVTSHGMLALTITYKDGDGISLRENEIKVGFRKINFYACSDFHSETPPTLLPVSKYSMLV